MKHALHSSSHQKRAFTLVEALVAIAILTLAVAGPMTVAHLAIVSAQMSRDQLVASFLAQEGIEYVRAMRDKEFLDAYQDRVTDITMQAWTDFISGGTSEIGSIARCIPKSCTYDPTRPMGTGSSNALEPCSGTCPALTVWSGRYTQRSTGTKTPFTRSIRVTMVSATDVRVVSTVSWVSRGTPRSVVTAVHLTPWQ